MSKHKSTRTIRRVEGRRLVYYRSQADQAFWDQHWRDTLSPHTYKGAFRGDVGYFESIFSRFLPNQGKVIEAGCGLGHIVLALCNRGYECEGIEWGRETVDMVKELVPEIPIRHGDVTNLDVPDGYYHGYISLGVVEHRPEGPEPFLIEANRVLANDGVALISVPYFHSLRRLKARLGYFKPSTPLEDHHVFYQQAFTREEMKSIIEQHGFGVTDICYYDPFKGLKDEIPIVQPLFRLPKVGWRLMRFWNNFSIAQILLAHMVMFICRKTDHK